MNCVVLFILGYIKYWLDAFINRFRVEPEQYWTTYIFIYLFVCEMPWGATKKNKKKLVSIEYKIAALSSTMQPKNNALLSAH